MCSEKAYTNLSNNILIIIYAHISIRIVLNPEVSFVVALEKNNLRVESTFLYQLTGRPGFITARAFPEGRLTQTPEEHR